MMNKNFSDSILHQINDHPPSKVTIFISNIHHVHLTGQQKIGLSLARNLSDRGVEVLVISNSPEINSPNVNTLNDNLKFFIIPGEATSSSYLRNLISIVRAVKRFDPDIIHGHGTLMSMLVSLIGKILRKPTVQTIYDIDMFSRIPTFIRISGLFFVDKVICSSDFIKKYLTQAKIPERKVTVLPYGVENIWFNLDKHTPSPIGAKSAIVMFWGDAKEDRGIDTLLDAIPKVLEQFPSVNFVFAIRYYDSAYREKIREFARVYSIEIIDHTCYRHTPDMVSMADIIVLPYKNTTIQPPLTLLESLAAGKVVITTDVEANRELIGENRRGVLIKPNDSDKLAGAIVDMLFNGGRRREMANMAQSFVFRKYDWGIILEKMVVLYDTIIRAS